jgi:hypothetical protein
MPEEHRSYPLRPVLDITDINIFVLVKDIIVFDFMYG